MGGHLISGFLPGVRCNQHCLHLGLPASKETACVEDDWRGGDLQSGCSGAEDREPTYCLRICDLRGTSAYGRVHDQHLHQHQYF